MSTSPLRVDPVAAVLVDLELASKPVAVALRVTNARVASRASRVAPSPLLRPCHRRRHRAQWERTHGTTGHGRRSRAGAVTRTAPPSGKNATRRLEATSGIDPLYRALQALS